MRERIILMTEPSRLTLLLYFFSGSQSKQHHNQLHNCHYFVLKEGDALALEKRKAFELKH